MAERVGSRIVQARAGEPARGVRIPRVPGRPEPVGLAGRRA